MIKQRKLLLVVNPAAGRTKSRAPLYDALCRFSEAGYLLSIHTTNGQGDATAVTLSEGSDYDVIVAVGGDGTLNEVIAGLMQLENPPLLGYLPRGSTNDFASSLRIPRDPAAAARKIVAGQSRVLDMGTYYYIDIPSQSGRGMVCQKSLMTIGTEETFEKLFDGKIERKGK